jgi:hypothetical protein
VFQSSEYIRWANEKTVHVLSYDLYKDATEPEPTLEVQREGEKVKVLAAYPMFTALEVDVLAREINAAVKFPLSAPWAGVVQPDGKVLASIKKATEKEFRELYETEQKKRTGPVLGRAPWKKIRTLLEESTAAEFDEKWAEAVSKGLAARDTAKELPAPLQERVDARLESLDVAAKSRIEGLDKIKDPDARAKARDAIRTEFKGIPSADALPARP